MTSALTSYRLARLVALLRRPSSPLIAEGKRLKRAAAGIPKIVMLSQPQAVYLVVKCEAAMRLQSQHSKTVDQVLLIEKRESCVEPRRRQDFEKGAMFVIARVLVSRSVIVTGPQPGVSGAVRSSAGNRPPRRTCRHRWDCIPQSPTCRRALTHQIGIDPAAVLVTLT